MTMHLYEWILLAGFSFASTQSYAEVYRWVDEQVKVHFGDKAHANKQAQDITQDTKQKNLDHSAQRTEQSLQQIDLRQQVQSAESQQRQSQTNPNAEKRAQACREAKQRLRILQGRVYFVDENGKEVSVSERERQQRADALGRDIKRYCR